MLVATIKLQLKGTEMSSLEILKEDSKLVQKETENSAEYRLCCNIFWPAGVDVHVDYVKGES